MNYLKMKRPTYENKKGNNNYKGDYYDNYDNRGNNNYNTGYNNSYYGDKNYYQNEYNDGYYQNRGNDSFYGNQNYNKNNNNYNNNSFKNINYNETKETNEDNFDELITSSKEQVVISFKEKATKILSLDSEKSYIKDNDDFSNSYLVDDAPYISQEDMDLYIQFLNSNKVNFKISKSNVQDNFYSMDISLVCKGRDEEELYLEKPTYMKNICRGNTFLVKYNKDKFIESFKLVRKGMRKFVDISLDYITIKDDKYLKNDHLDKSKLLSKKVLMGPILRALGQNKLIRVTKMVKANGENAQISYCETLDSWVVCSKNIAIYLKIYDDLEYYKPYTFRNKEGIEIEANVKFSFAYLIGIAWFDIIKKVKDVKNLKEFLKKHTLIGEYIGNQNHQHLIRYVEHTIHFYSIVEKFSEKICLNIDNTIEIFRKYNLTSVPSEEIGIFSDYKSLCQVLETLHHRIAESSIIDEEEGSVIYFTAFKLKESIINLDDNQTSDQNSNSIDILDEEVISLGKLKTYEYKLYRKLREKLSNHLKRGKEDRFKINQFFDEIRTILTGYILPMPMEFYYKVAEVAFQFIETIPANDFFLNRGEYELRGNYLDFLETVLKMVDKTVDLRTQAINEAGIINTEKLLSKNKNLNNKVNQTTEVYIYVPPFIEDLEKLTLVLEKNYNIKIKKTAFSLETNYKDNIRISIIHWHNFKKILKLKENQFIIYFNPEMFPEIKNEIVEKIKSKNISAQELLYKKDDTLTYFLRKTDKSIEEKIENYFNLSTNYVESIKKYIHPDNYLVINNIEVNKILTWVESKYELFHEKVELKMFEDINENLENINSINLDETIYEQIQIQNNINLTSINDEKYKSPLIKFYGKYTNPFQQFEKIFEQNVKDKIELEKENVINPNEAKIIDKINNNQNLSTIFSKQMEKDLKPGEENNNEKDNNLILKEEINVYSEKIQNNNISNDKIEKINSYSSNYIKYKDGFVNGFKYLVILVPMTLPGSGKTSFIKPLEDICKLIGVSFFTVGSDIIRKNKMNDYKRKNRNANDEEAFKQTGKSANFELEDNLRYIVDEFYNSHKMNGILFVDKNHPPNAISRTME